MLRPGASDAQVRKIIQRLVVIVGAAATIVV
jgi:hypothetical protein